VKMLPDIQPAGSVAGTLQVPAAAYLGRGIPIYIAAGDAQCSVLSSRPKSDQAG